MHRINSHLPNRRRRRARWGGIFLEVAVSCGLLIMILAAVAQTSVAFLRQQRVASTRDIAAQEAANLLDLSHRLPYDALSDDTLNDALQANSSLLKNTVWSVDESKADQIRTKRIVVTIHWRNEGQDFSLKLTMWRSAPDSAGGEDTKL